ncbi:MAG: ATP-binding protein [bacterium]|nr:ATP-binding protein [bacterium]
MFSRKKTDMLKNIAFLGGIHGVGKSTICRQICNDLKIDYLSASEVLKWKEISSDSKNKKVMDIPHAQYILIQGLINKVKENHYYLLDGHYCLFDKESNIINVPIETFRNINPISLNLVIDDIIKIKHRLEERDKRPYDILLLKKMQNSEINYAKEVSNKLRITLNIGNHSDFSDIFKALKDYITR